MNRKISFLVWSLLLLCLLQAPSETQGASQLYFYISLRDGPRQSNQQLVSLECRVMDSDKHDKWTRDSTQESLNKTGFLTTTTRQKEEHHDQLPPFSEKDLGLQFLINGSLLNSASKGVADFESTWSMDGVFRATFYVKATEHFVCLFTCESAENSNITSAELVMFKPAAPVPLPEFLQSIAGFLAFASVSFIALNVTILALSCVCIRRHCKTPHDSSPTFGHDSMACEDDWPKQQTLMNRKVSRASLACCTDEEMTNALLQYLAHSSPCPIHSCPCDLYKKKLKSFKLAAALDDMDTKPSFSCDTTVECDCSYSKSLLMVNDKQHDVDVTAVCLGKGISVQSSLSVDRGGIDDETKSTTIPKDSPASHKICYMDPVETITVDANGGRYSNEDHQVYLKVPEGAVSKGKIVSIKIGISQVSSLLSQLRRGKRLVSPLVTLHVEGETDFVFLKPVELTLPHFLDISSSKDVKEMDLKFMKARCGLNSFKQSDGVSSFQPQSHLATLKTKHFCSYCITANEKVGADKIFYRLVKIVPRSQQLVQWRASFCVCYYLKTCLQALKNQYSEMDYEIRTLKRFKFAEEAHLNVHFERKLAGGWQLALENRSMISPEDVEYWDTDLSMLEAMEEERQYPPRFDVQISGSQAREAVNVLIYFRGMTETSNYVTELLLEPTMQQARHHLPPSHILPSHLLPFSPSMPTIHLNKQMLYRSRPDSLFSGGCAPSHSQLMNHVAAELPTKWRLVGLQLGLSVSKLEEIETTFPNDCRRCFSSVFREWENQMTSPYSWSTMVEALQTPSVEENVVANKLYFTFVENSDSVSLSSSGTYSSGYMSTAEDSISARIPS